MSLSREAMLELMAYADGELEGDEEARARVEALLAASADARGVLEAMGTLGEVVREGVNARAEESVRADAIADGVMAAIAREPASHAGGERVASLAEARAARGARGGVATAAIAALALAAGVAFLVQSKAPAPVAAEAPLEPTAQTAAPPSAPEPAPAAVAVAQVEEQGVDLEEAHSTKNKVNVFFVPSPEMKGAAASVVVWIDDRHGARGGN